MNLKDLLDHPVLKNLPGPEFKAYVLFKTKAINHEIKGFTIRGLQREWENSPELNMPTSKNRVKALVRYLEEQKVIRYKKRKLKILI